MEADCSGDLNPIMVDGKVALRGSKVNVVKLGAAQRPVSMINDPWTREAINRLKRFDSAESAAADIDI